MAVGVQFWYSFGRRCVASMAVRFHPPRRSGEDETPKDLAAWAEGSVIAGVNNDLDVPP